MMGLAFDPGEFPLIPPKNDLLTLYHTCSHISLKLRRFPILYIPGARSVHGKAVEDRSLFYYLYRNKLALVFLDYHGRTSLSP